MLALTREFRGSHAEHKCRGAPRCVFSEAAAAIMALAVAVPAAAQAPQERSDTARVEVLDEVIVTAERLGRSLMDTSTSVVVLDAAALEQRPLIDGTNELFDQIPNITSSGTTNYAPAVRGVDGTGPGNGADAFLAGARARLNLQIDGRPAGFNEIVYGDSGIWDVKQVEVLRGPQSALQGRNAIAGTMSIKTNDPTYDTEAKVRVLGGNYQTRQYSGAFSTPLVADQLAFRIAADHRTSESFVSFTGYPGALGYPGADNPGEYETSTYRAKLLVEPRALAGFSALITLNHSKSRAPQAEDLLDPVDADLTSAFPPQPVMLPESTSGIVDLRWERSDNLAFEMLLALTDSELERLAHEFLPGVVNGYALVDGREFVAEPRIRFTQGRLSGLAGLYYFRGEQQDLLDFFDLGRWDDDVRTQAVFGEATYEVSERFDVTVGARYEEEEHQRVGSFPVLGLVTDLDETDKVFMPKLVLTWYPTDNLTLGTLAARGYNGGGEAIAVDRFPFEAYSFGPEYVWNYEAFARATLAGGKLALIGNVFYSDYEDMQLPSQFEDGFGSFTLNADKTVSYGVELSALWQALPGLRLVGGVGLLETEIKEFPGTVFEGNELAQAPAMTANVGATYQLGGFELSADARYSDAYFSDIVNESNRQTESYVIANAQIAYNFGSVRVFGVVDNLFDADERIYRYPAYFSGPDLVPASANILRPRTYSIGVQVEF